ncbi:hypothetical protein [Ensifer aridi]|uniref:hypothetical protein n=1 Tax=Ensifer aridi TaxID=1708715 RepID=UPI0023B93D73|nr:hypothetical protein [Ensifer aridi]
MALERFLAAARPTRCEFVERDRYRRFVGLCFRVDSHQIDRGLVESGNGVDWEEYNKGGDAKAKQAARSLGAGIWRGEF